ncbi:hypothetical protein KFU94_45600 [Chloroflexi bacterium TSY]|nr:hypothetical protein [Chloroflexi bacterium TSY]
MANSAISANAENPQKAGRLAQTIPLWRDSLFWLTIGFTIFAIAPFLQPGYHWGGNDARHHVYFLFEFDRAIQDGIWWPRWSPDFTYGYGYPFFNIYGPLSHFCAEFFLRVLNFSYTGAIEAIFVVGILGSAAAMYVFIRSWVGRHAAIISALVYVYAPYHLLNLYVRAHLVESMAFVWLPLCLLTMRQTVLTSVNIEKGDQETRVLELYGWVVGVALSFAALLFTSQLAMILAAPLFALYFLMLMLVYAQSDRLANLMLPRWVRFWQWVRHAIPAALGAVSALGLSAIFWLPMALERNDVRVDQWFGGRYDFRGHFIYFFQLFSPQWDFGSSLAGPDDPIGFQIGAVPLLLAILGVTLAWGQRDQIWAKKPHLLLDEERIRYEVGVFIVVGVGATLVGMQIAAFLWELPIIGGILGVAQFPWRWLFISTFCVSVLAGLSVASFSTRAKSNSDEILAERRGLTVPLLAIIIIVLLSSYSLLRVEIIEPAEGPVGLPSLMRFQRSADEMTGATRWVDPIPQWGPIAQHYIVVEQQNPDQPVPPIDSKLDYADDLLEYNEEGFYFSSVAQNSVMEEIYYFSAQEGKSIVVNHFYYPGWNAYLLDGEHGNPVQTLEIVPGQAIPERQIPSGRMTIPVPKGEGFVLLRFEDTAPRTIGKQISLGTLALLLLGGLIVWVGSRWRGMQA